MRNNHFTSLDEGATGIICATNDKLKACTSSTNDIHKHLHIMRVNKLIKSFDENELFFSHFYIGTACVNYTSDLNSFDCRDDDFSRSLRCR